MLYKKLTAPDTTQTQLAYKLKYFPGHMLGPVAAGLLNSTVVRTLPKHKIVAMLDDDMTHIMFEGKRYLIVWAYNNIPTEPEWTKKSASYLMRLEFRDFLHCDKSPICIFTLGSHANNSAT